MTRGALAERSTFGRAVPIALDDHRIARVAARVAFPPIREVGFTVESVTVAKSIAGDTPAEKERAPEQGEAAVEAMKRRSHDDVYGA